MSEQNKSNLQTFGAGLIGFAAVMAVGGGALMFHSYRQAGSTAAPAPAAPPIDLGSSLPRPVTPGAVHIERRAESPAPLIGELEESEESNAPAAAPRVPGASAAPAAPAAPVEAAPTPESAPAAKASALEVTQHLEVEGNTSTAEASVKNTTEDGKDAAKPAKIPKLALKKAAPAKLDAPSSDGAVASSVHYGVTSRSELMGRAAGPVYNFKGGSKGAAEAKATGKMAVDADGKMADIRRQLETAGLPEAQRAQLIKELDASMKRVSETEKTAQ